MEDCKECRDWQSHAKPAQKNDSNKKETQTKSLGNKTEKPSSEELAKRDENNKNDNK